MKISSKIILALSLIFAASQASAEEKEVLVQIKDHKFEPSEISVAAGEDFRLVVENLDKTAEEFESHDLKKEKMIIGGKKVTIPVKGLKAGEYKFFGEFNPKTAQGKIIVK
jgi:plastocyanin